MHCASKFTRKEHLTKHLKDREKVGKCPIGRRNKNADPGQAGAELRLPLIETESSPDKTDSDTIHDEKGCVSDLEDALLLAAGCPVDTGSDFSDVKASEASHEAQNLYTDTGSCGPTQYKCTDLSPRVLLRDLRQYFPSINNYSRVQVAESFNAVRTLDSTVAGSVGACAPRGGARKKKMVAVRKRQQKLHSPRNTVENETPTNSSRPARIRVPKKILDL